MPPLFFHFSLTLTLPASICPLAWFVRSFRLSVCLSVCPRCEPTSYFSPFHCSLSNQPPQSSASLCESCGGRGSLCHSCFCQVNLYRAVCFFSRAECPRSPLLSCYKPAFGHLCYRWAIRDQQFISICNRLGALAPSLAGGFVTSLWEDRGGQRQRHEWGARKEREGQTIGKGERFLCAP